MRYPEGKTEVTGYNPEPWHIRYVKKELAEKLYNGGNWITLGPDRTHVWILKNGNNGGFIVEQKNGTKIVTSEYSFSGLTLEQPNG